MTYTQINTPEEFGKFHLSHVNDLVLYVIHSDRQPSSKHLVSQMKEEVEGKHPRIYCASINWDKCKDEVDLARLPFCAIPAINGFRSGHQHTRRYEDNNLQSLRQTILDLEESSDKHHL